jgi:hypothetical protein
MRAHRRRGLRLAFLACVTAGWGCGGGGPSIESGWVGAWGRQKAAPADSQSARGADRGVVSPIEASTERLAANSRAARARLRPAAPTAAARMREWTVRSALEELKWDQAKNFRTKRAYATDLDALGYQGRPGVIVRIVWSNKWGWAALAADSIAPNQYCAIYVGSVPDAITPDARHWGKPGQTYCDGRSDGGPLGRETLYGDETPDQTLARYAMTIMPTSLMQLAISQDAYRKVQYTYARRIEPMALQYGWEPGVRVRMLFANSEGWSAEATYDLLPGRSCVVWGGDVPQRPVTAADRIEAEDEGVPVCDE